MAAGPSDSARAAAPGGPRVRGRWAFGKGTRGSAWWSPALARQIGQTDSAQRPPCAAVGGCQRRPRGLCWQEGEGTGKGTGSWSPALASRFRAAPALRSQRRGRQLPAGAPAACAGLPRGSARRATRAERGGAGGTSTAMRRNGTVARCVGKRGDTMRCGPPAVVRRAGGRYYSASRTRRVPQHASASPSDSPEPTGRCGPVPLCRTAGRHRRPRRQSRRPVRSDGPQCGAAPLCGAHALRPPTSAPTSAPGLATPAPATQADVGRRSARGYRGSGGMEVLGECCEYPGTGWVRALQLGGARARRPPLRAHTPGVGACAAVWRTLRARLRLSRARRRRVDALVACARARVRATGTLHARV